MHSDATPLRKYPTLVCVCASYTLLAGTEPSAAIERQAQLQGLYAGLSGVLTVLYGGAVGTAQQCKLSRWVVTQGRVAMANPLWDCVQYASTHMRATWAEQPSVTTAPRPQQPHSNKATQKKPRGRQPKKHTHVAKEKEVTGKRTRTVVCVGQVCETLPTAHTCTTEHHTNTSE